jgi:pentatricopeptide repeat protein
MLAGVSRQHIAAAAAAAVAPRHGAGLPAAPRRREAFSARPAAYEPSASWYEPAEAGDGEAAAPPPPGEPAFAGIAWVQEQGDLIIEQTRIEEEEAARAKLLGLDVRAQGSSQREAATVDETDEARHYWHRRLKACADAGDYVQAQRVLADMRQQGLPPGPRAYHALIFSFVKGSNPSGALEAIRLEVNAGLQPLPQSYTAIIHGFLREGDTAKAEDMYASNRRAGVPCDASWSAICAALFRMGSHERGATLLEQGEGEGMRPDKALYSALIKHMCRSDQLGAATVRLEEMQERGLAPDKDHLSPLVTAHALAGEVEEAEALLARLLKAPGPTTAAAIGACNALLQAYLSIGYERDDFAQIFASLRQLMAKAGMALDRKGYALHLEAGLALEDLQVSLLAFRSLKNKGQGCLEYVDDEMLAELLSQLRCVGRAGCASSFRRRRAPQILLTLFAPPCPLQLQRHADGRVRGARHHEPGAAAGAGRRARARRRRADVHHRLAQQPAVCARRRAWRRGRGG